MNTETNIDTSTTTPDKITFAETVYIQANGDLTDAEFRSYMRFLAEKEMDRKNEEQK